MKSIKLLTHHIYGHHLYYPNCAFSKMLCKLLLQKTLTEGDLKILKENGYEIIKERKPI